jgi:hypothetical protein
VHCGCGASVATHGCKFGGLVPLRGVADGAVKKLIEKAQQFHFAENFQRAAQEAFPQSRSKKMCCHGSTRINTELEARS